MSANRLIVAAAGSGKTRLIVDEVMQKSQDKILITTFTIANERSIKQRLIKANQGIIPANVTVQTWFSFLIEHGIRPYRFWDDRVMGLQWVQEASGIRCKASKNNPFPISWKESENFSKVYFTSGMDVYSDKVARLVTRCNEKSNGAVIRRLERIFNQIYIDETQDMAGYDLEIIKLLLESNICLTMVGDPRQTVYLTHMERKYGKYQWGKIKEFIQDTCKKHCTIDEETLKGSHRNASTICALSSKLYPEHPECHSKLQKDSEHIGAFFVKRCDVQKYGVKFKPMQLRYNNLAVTILTSQPLNFGESKGLEADHVLIYPTEEMLTWLNGGPDKFKPRTKAQLYVALTRAFFSVGIVVDDNFKCKSQEISIWG